MLNFTTRIIIALCIAIGIPACGGKSEDLSTNCPTVDSGAPGDGGEGGEQSGPVNTGNCSIAHEPNTNECVASHAYVFRCVDRQTTQPRADCEPSVDGNPRVWCCTSIGG